MKKMKRLIACILSICLFCVYAVPAGADDCYEILKYAFNGALSEDDPEAMGKSIPCDLDSLSVLLYYDPDYQQLVLYGRNSSGEAEITSWENINETSALMMLYVICMNWGLFESYLDDGSDLEIGVHGENEELNYAIGSAEDAAQFIQVVETLLPDE